MAIGTCRLCGQSAELRDSHIIPKFVFDWMKETGGDYIRYSGSPNQRCQDGYKVELLCDACEQRFSKRERWFCEKVFVPYLKENEVVFQYDESLFYFLVSLLWRVLQDGMTTLPADCHSTAWHWPSMNGAATC
jgi:hypothetical protein